MDFDAIIQMRFDATTWVDIDSMDVLVGGEQIRWTRGITGNRPTDNVASTGTLEFVLRNDAGNSAGLQGYYSPNHPNCRIGFGFGTPVRLLYRVIYLPGTVAEETVERVMWTGKLRVIAPMPGADGDQTTMCLAHDIMGDLADSDIREVGPQILQTDAALITAVLESLPVDSQPLARSIDEGLDVFPVAFDDLESGTKGLNVLERVATSAQGKVFAWGDGTLRYENRVSSALNTAGYTFTDLVLTRVEVPSDLANVYNKVRVVTHNKTFSPSTMVLATLSSTTPIQPADVVETWLTYHDPDRPEVALGGTDFVAPVSGTDYIFNAAVDGSGANATASMTVTASFFASTVKLTITNAGLVPAYPQTVQVRGTGIYDQQPRTREAYTAEPYGTRPITIDLPYQDDESVAQARATYLQASYRDLRRQVNSLTYEATESDELMEQALALEIGHAVGLSETVTLPDPISAFIQSIEGTVSGGPTVMCRYGVAVRIIDDEIHTDRIRITPDILSADAHAPLVAIGNAPIGYSEIGGGGAEEAAGLTGLGRYRGLLVLVDWQ